MLTAPDQRAIENGALECDKKKTSFMPECFLQAIGGQTPSCPACLDKLSGSRRALHVGVTLH